MDSTTIRAIIFDLDGTLYVDRELGWEIHLSACRTIARVRGVPLSRAEDLLQKTRELLVVELGYRVSLTRTCTELGADIPELHRRFCEEITPEEFLRRDDRVVELLKRLGTRYELYLYTNNNLCLANRIMRLIGIEGMFRRLFTIEDSWRPKPDRATLERVLQAIGRRPVECLFVGDRYDIDLRLPAAMGSAVFLAKNVEELLNLIKFTSEES